MLRAVFLLIICVSVVATRGKTYDVIVIGAGMAGLRASQVLQRQGVEHVILEVTDHIGGR